MTLLEVSPTTTLSVDEFIQRYETEGPFEILDGERVNLMPPTLKHSKLSNRIGSLLNNFSQEANLGTAFIETAFILPDSDQNNWVKGSRVPDVMFILSERLTAYEASISNEEDRPLALIPDLVVEIVSANDRYSDVMRKVNLYLQDGVRLIWIIDREAQSVMVYQAGRQTHLTIHAALTGDDILPGFELALAKLFQA